MRKLTILLFLTITGTGFVMAQSFNGGLLAGMSTSQISGDDLAGFDKPGLYLGGYANLFPEEHKGWQFEIAYIEKGSRKLSRPDIGDFQSYKLKLNYVESALLFRYSWNKKISLEAGPSFGVLVKSSEVVNEGSSASRLDDGETFNRGDLSLNAGFSYLVLPSLEFNLRVANSVIPVRDHASGANYRLNFGQYNQVLSLSLHYTITAQE